MSLILKVVINNYVINIRKFYFNDRIYVLLSSVITPIVTSGDH